MSARLNATRDGTFATGPDKHLRSLLCNTDPAGLLSNVPVSFQSAGTSDGISTGTAPRAL